MFISFINGSGKKVYLNTSCIESFHYEEDTGYTIFETLRQMYTAQGNLIPDIKRVFGANSIGVADIGERK